MSTSENITQTLRSSLQRDPELKKILKSIKENGGDYTDAEKYAARAGKLLTAALQANISESNFPVGSVSEIAGLIVPAMEMDYKAVSQVTGMVQKALNKDGNIGMNPIIPKFNQSAAYNLVGRMANYESFEEAAWMLEEPMQTASAGVVDDTLKKNADFQYKSGLKPKIIRTCESDACEWCQMLEGEYDYEEVKDRSNPVWQRHNNCTCEITYVPGDGRMQDLYSKQWLDEDATQERIESAKRLERKQIITDSKNRNKRIAQAVTDERYEARLKEYSEIHFTSADADPSVIDSVLLEKIDNAESTYELRQLFDSNNKSADKLFGSSFSDLPLDTEKEVCKGIAYMNSFTGVSNKNVQIFCEPIKEYGTINYYDNGYARITLNSSLKIEDAFMTTIHEYAHLYDFRNGEVATKTISRVFSRLGITRKNQMFIRQSILPYDSDDYENLLKDDEFFAYSVEWIVAKRYSTEVEDFLLLLKQEIGE